MQKTTNTTAPTNGVYSVLTAGNFKPILFSTPMVQAILNGKKTMTRRIIKIQKDEKIEFDNYEFRKCYLIVGNGYIKALKCKYKVGDILWVRETFQIIPPNMIFYKADEENKVTGKWKPSIFMPKDACRLFLEVTDIRIEHLTEITEENAILEGVQKTFSTLFNEWRFKDYANVKDDWRSAVSSFQSLWASINGVNSWDENPLVWVYSFKVVECPYGFR